MGYTEFCCRSGGSNLNAGTRKGDSTVPGTAADFTYASGSWVSGTGVFTPASGNPQSDGVAVGDFVSIYDQNNSLRTTGVANSTASSPDHADLDITGDIDIRVKLRMDDWTPSGAQTIVAKWGSSASQTFDFIIQATGIPRFTWSSTGGNVIVANATISTGFSDGSVGWLRVTLDVDNGAGGNDVKFYTSTDGTTWVQLGTTVTSAGVTSLFAGTALLTVGTRHTDQLLVGNVYSVEVRNGIGGTIVANPNFSAQSVGTTSFNDTAGTPKAWTVQAQASIAAPATTGFVGRITAVSTTTFTVSLTVKSGGVPNTGSGFYTAKVGGAWLGPNGVVGFPFGWYDSALLNVNGYQPRLTFFNDQTYSQTRPFLGRANSSPIIYEGASSTYGDNGIAVFDGGTTGTSYVLHTPSSNEIGMYRNFRWRNNGATGSANLVTTTASRLVFENCYFEESRGAGLSATSATAVECEATTCNKSNTSNLAGFSVAVARRCKSYNHTAGANAHGFVGTNSTYEDCIAYGNTGHGIICTSGQLRVYGGVFRGNTLAGIRSGGGQQSDILENVVMSSNLSYGFQSQSNSCQKLNNCAFYNNSSGSISAGGNLMESGTITLTTEPFPNAASGDFNTVSSELMNAGRGTFPGTGGTVGYPDVGAARGRRTFRAAATGGGLAG